MTLPFNELLKRARAGSRYSHPDDFARIVSLSKGGYAKMENGSRIPSMETLAQIIDRGGLARHDAEELVTAWRKARAFQAGIPTPPGDIDVSKVLIQMSKELTIVLRKQAPEMSEARAKVVVGTFKKRAEIILRTALET